jgi:hypothetical protein
MLITGPTLFAAESAHYLQNPALLIKMMLLLLALVCQFALRRGRLTAAI